MRLFFAIWPDLPERLEMQQAQARLDLGVKGRTIPAQNLHATLLFLGEVPARQLDVIRRGAAAAAQRTPNFAVRFDHLETWPQAHAVVACVESIAVAMHALVAALREASDVAKQGELFRPHVTLARNVTASLALPKITAITWQARTLCLVKSGRDARGSVYTVVDTWPLLDKAANPWKSLLFRRI